MSNIDILYASFDDIVTADLVGEWGSVGSGLTIVSGRNGNGLRGTAASSRAANTLRTHDLRFSGFRTSLNDGCLGFAVAFTSLPVSDTDLFAVLDAGGTANLTYVVTPTGTIKVYRGTSTSGTLIATTVNAVVVGGSSYRYLETNFFTHSTLGNVNLRTIESGNLPDTDGFFNLDTGVFSATDWAFIEWYLLDGVVTIDDVYIMESQAFKGDCVIRSTLVSAQSVVSNYAFLAADWLPNTGSDKAAVVDDATPNGDTDYIASHLSSLIYYDMVALVDSREFSGVQIVATARKISSGVTASLYVQGNDSYPPLSTNYRAVRQMTQAYATLADLNAAHYFFAYIA